MKYENSSFEWEEADDSLELIVGDRSTVLFSVDDRGIALVTLNRPEQRNTINTQMLFDLTSVLRVCDRLDEIRVVVVTGAGRVFCAGSELGGGDGASFGGRSDGDDLDLSSLTWLSPYQMRKPVICAMNGHSVGAGLTFAMQCDVRFVAADAKLGFPFVRLGVITEWMGHWTAVRLMGIARTAELFFSGRIFSGAQAQEWGLVNSAVATDEVLAVAMALAADIATNAAPVSLALSKRLLWEAVLDDRGTSGRREHELLDVLLTMPDAAEGVRAFLEKRAPVWSGGVSTDLPGWPI